MRVCMNQWNISKSNITRPELEKKKKKSLTYEKMFWLGKKNMCKDSPIKKKYVAVKKICGMKKKKCLS